MARHAIINTDNTVVNIIEWDGLSDWLPPRNHIVKEVSKIDCHIGDTYDSKRSTFTRQQQETK